MFKKLRKTLKNPLDDILRLDGYYYSLSLGEHCPSGDRNCHGEVFVYRVVGMRAHGVCLVHNITLTFPSWLLSGFHGRTDDPGLHVLAQEPDSSGELKSVLDTVTPPLREKLVLSSMSGTLGYMWLQYTADRRECLVFRPEGKSECYMINGEYLKMLRPYVRNHLYNGFGILCSVDFNGTGQVYWPEFPVAALEGE